MSRRKTSTLGDLAAGAAAGRRVVLSVGSMDGALLQALAKVLPIAGSDVPASTWGDGVTSADNPQLSEGIISSNPCSESPKQGVNDGA